MSKKKEATPKVKCPDCDAEYDSTRGLSSHRRSAHGYVSQNKYLVALRKRGPVPKKADPLKCDECGYVAKNVPDMTWHTAKVHTPHDTLECDECGFVAQWPGGLTNHQRKSHPEKYPTPVEAKLHRAIDKRRRAIANPKKIQTIIVRPATSNGHQEAHPAPNGDPIPDGTLALALGRFQELCRSIAFEHDLPARMFATRLAGLIYASTVR